MIRKDRNNGERRVSVIKIIFNYHCKRFEGLDSF